jgi:hypothetical protein
MRSVAELRGSILYIDGVMWTDDNNTPLIDLDPTEAAEVIAALADDPRAPTGVRIMSRTRKARQANKS